MKAIALDRFGSPDVLEFREVDKPVVSDDEVLVRVCAASVNPLDWHVMRGEPLIMRGAGRAMGMGLRKPTISVLGVDMAGRVETVGRNVTRFRPGDEVFALLTHGAFAEYACVSADVLQPKPANVTFEQAAAVPVAGKTALVGLRDLGRVQPGQQVLINGASGGVGSFAVQIARAFGAEVTGVCSKRNVDLVRSIGADHVIDYTQEDFTRSGLRYDLIFDNVGNHSLSACRRALAAKGTYIAVGGPAGGRWLGPAAHMFKAPLVAPFVSPRTLMLDAARYKNHQEIFGVLRELIEAGKVTPVIDRSYRLSEVPAAIRYLEEGRARGKVVITV